jgi:hypothetical protein
MKMASKLDDVSQTVCCRAARILTRHGCRRITPARAKAADNIGCEPPQPLSKTAARIEPSRSPAAAANILPDLPNNISLLQRRFLSGESRD